jgi:hypothetical protein
MVRSWPESRALLDAATHVENSIFWTCPWTGLPRKGRPDLILGGNKTIVDYKLLRSKEEAHFQRALDQFFYVDQACTYIQGARCAGLDIEHFVFIVQEDGPPYELSIFELGQDWIEFGFARVETAIRLLRLCLSQYSWPRKIAKKTLHLPRFIHPEDEEF